MGAGVSGGLSGSGYAQLPDAAHAEDHQAAITHRRHRLQVQTLNTEYVHILNIFPMNIPLIISHLRLPSRSNELQTAKQALDLLSGLVLIKLIFNPTFNH